MHSTLIAPCHTTLLQFLGTSLSFTAFGSNSTLLPLTQPRSHNCASQSDSSSAGCLPYNLRIYMHATSPRINPGILMNHTLHNKPPPLSSHLPAHPITVNCADNDPTPANSRRGEFTNRDHAIKQRLSPSNGYLPASSMADTLPLWTQRHYFTPRSGRRQRVKKAWCSQLKKIFQRLELANQPIRSKGGISAQRHNLPNQLSKKVMRRASKSSTAQTMMNIRSSRGGVRQCANWGYSTLSSG